MDLHDVLNSAQYIRNENEEIIAVEIPIEMWRYLMDYVQQSEDRAAARQRLAKLRKTQDHNDMDAGSDS